MKTNRMTAYAALFMSTLFLGSLSLAQQTPKQADTIDVDKETPDGTVTLSSTSVQLLIGGEKGEGVLTYQGKEYPFKFKGASAGAALSLAKTVASGNVYRLKKIEDFPGVYTNASAGVAAVKGVSKTMLQNNKGVVLYVTAKSKGVSIDLSLGGINVNFD